MELGHKHERKSLKLTQPTVLIGLFFFCLQVVVSAPSEGHPIEWRGVVDLGNGPCFSLYETGSGSSGWFRLMQSNGRIYVQGYDSQKKRLSLEYLGQKIEVSLHQSDGKPLALPWSQSKYFQPDTLGEAEIAKQVEQFRIEQYASIPRTTPALAQALQRSAENRINAFERGLHNKKTEGNESVSVREVEQPRIIARLGSQRKKSTVNSRIWASDHIEKHGMPEL
jgi:hypothetical protein